MLAIRCRKTQTDAVMIEINVAVKIGVDALLINGYVLQLFVNQNETNGR